MFQLYSHPRQGRPIPGGIQLLPVLRGGPVFKLTRWRETKGQFSTTHPKSNLQSPGSGRPLQSHAAEAGPESIVGDEAVVLPPSARSDSRRVHWGPIPPHCGTQETLLQGSPDNPMVAGTPNARRHPSSHIKQALQTTKHGVPEVLMTLKPESMTLVTCTQTSIVTKPKL